MPLWARLLLGLALSATIGLLAYRRGSLSRGGVVGAILVGSPVFGLGGWAWGALLILFFVSSSLLSLYRTSDKRAIAQQFAKGGQRDIWQALANGSVPALLAGVHSICETPFLWDAFVGSLAAVTADTWATELGVLSRERPRLVTTWAAVSPCTSGGVSLAGTLAALAGSASIALSAIGFAAASRLVGNSGLAGSGAWLPILPGIVGGMAGAFADSVIGATVQPVYYSRKRRKETEKRAERDGTPNQYLRGWPWVTNDVVNLLAALIGALVGGLTSAVSS